MNSYFGFSNNRDGSFEPQVVPKRTSDIDHKVLFMY